MFEFISQFKLVYNEIIYIGLIDINIYMQINNWLIYMFIMLISIMYINNMLGLYMLVLGNCLGNYEFKIVQEIVQKNCLRNCLKNGLGNCLAKLLRKLFEKFFRKLFEKLIKKLFEKIDSQVD